MPDPLAFWVGRDEAGGVPSRARKDLAPPAHSRLEAVAATERPRSLTLAADRRRAVLIQACPDTSDVRLLDFDDPVPRRLTTGRAPMLYWMTPRRGSRPTARRSPTSTKVTSASWPPPAGRGARCSSRATRSGSTTRRSS